MGPSLFPIFVVLVRVIGLLRRRCIYFSVFYVATSSVSLDTDQVRLVNTKLSLKREGEKRYQEEKKTFISRNP